MLKWKKKIKTYIKPKEFIFRNKLYRILRIPEKYVITEYIVEIDLWKISKVFIQTKHPNCDPKTSEYCIPYNLRRQKFSKENKSLLEESIKRYNFDSCYFTIWEDLRWE